MNRKDTKTMTTEETLASITAEGPDDDGRPVTCFDIVRGGVILAHVQVTADDIAVWPVASRVVLATEPAR